MQKIKGTFAGPLLVLVIYALLISSRFIDLETLGLNDNIYLSMIILQLLIFALPCIFYCVLRGTNAKDMRLRPLSVGKLWFSVTCFGTLIFGTALINTAVFYLFGSESTISSYTNAIPAGGSEVINIIYITIALAIIPAVTEEFLFRGILLSEYSNYGVFTSILLSGLLFAMIHFNLSGIFSYLFCGVITAYAVYITQSLWSAVIVHLLYNLYALFFESILWGVIKSPNSLIFFLFVVVTLFIAFLVLSFNEAEKILYSAGIKGEQSPPEATKKEGGSKLFFEALISPSFLACVLLFLVATLILK